MITELATSSSTTLNQFLTDWLPVLGFSPVAIWAYLMLKYRNRRLHGPTVAGTAEVLSVKVAPWVLGNTANGDRPCTVRLRVSVAGSESYDATVRQKIDNFALNLRMAPGATVPVEVEEANPRHVRIDFSRPLAAPTAPLNASGGGAPTRVVINASDVVFPRQPGGDPTFPDPTAMRQTYAANPAAVPVLSAAGLLDTGQRVSAVVKSFAPMGTTPRSLGRTPSRPELLDAPHYLLQVELHVPNLAPITAQSVQAVPPSHASQLALGQVLSCAVDPADPASRWVVDWT